MPPRWSRGFGPNGGVTWIRALTVPSAQGTSVSPIEPVSLPSCVSPIEPVSLASCVSMKRDRTLRAVQTVADGTGTDSISRRFAATYSLNHVLLDPL